MSSAIQLDDELYSRLEAEAKARGLSVRDIVLEAVQLILTSGHPAPQKRRIQLPLIDSGQPGKLNIPDDIVSRLLSQEDIERHEASLR
jgi:negative regulator of replication initiation